MGLITLSYSYTHTSTLHSYSSSNSQKASSYSHAGGAAGLQPPFRCCFVGTQPQLHLYSGEGSRTASKEQPRHQELSFGARRRGRSILGSRCPWIHLHQQTLQRVHLFKLVRTQATNPFRKHECCLCRSRLYALVTLGHVCVSPFC